MGKYVNAVDGTVLGASYRDKCTGLKEAGAKETSGDYYQKDLVCVVDNGHFAAAGYAYSEGEYEYFAREDGRPKTWFILKNASEYAD